jgi:RNA polymerase sigma-70 factor (ECF subfamily)
MQGESELVKKAKQGDISAFESIFRTYIDESVRLAYIITRDWALSEDAVQEAFIRAYKSIKSFDESRPFRPWITKIVVNQARKIKRKYAGSFPLTEFLNIGEKESCADEEAVYNESNQTLTASIYMLDEKHRLPLILKYYGGFSEIEVSKILKIPLSTVKSRLYTARNRLSKIINASGGEING